MVENMSTTDTQRPHLPPHIRNVRLVGMTFLNHPDWGKLLYDINANDRDLQLVRDHSNEHDRYAVSVYLADEPFLRIGYLNRGVARGVAPAMDDGEMWLIVATNLQIVEGHEDTPGLLLNLERGHFSEEVPPARVVEMGFDQKKTKAPQVSNREWARRALELAGKENINPRRIGLDQYVVPSLTTPGSYYSVAVDVDEHRQVNLFCDCIGATYHPGFPIPCSHAASVVIKMEKKGEARIIQGLAYQIPPVS